MKGTIIPFCCKVKICLLGGKTDVTTKKIRHLLIAISRLRRPAFSCSRWSRPYIPNLKDAPLT